MRKRQNGLTKINEASLMKKLFKWVCGLIVIGLVALAALYVVYVYSPVPQRAALMPGDYFAARELFLTRAKKAGAELESHQIAAKGPHGEPLFIDIAWLGSKTPKRALLHISGTHGVEGFSGSAIQSELLANPPALPPDSALIVLHALNPWGMAHLRRVNESNVDLNRNFHLDPSGFQGAPEAYIKAEWFLNPTGTPQKLDLFPIYGLYLVASQGFVTLKQAIAGGQYEFDRGIYFGGKKLEESSRFFLDWLKEHLSQVQVLFVIEIHTGLGKSAKDTLFWALPVSDLRTRILGRYLGEQFESDAPDEGVGFKTAGDLQGTVPKTLPNTRVGWTLQEFGTYGPVASLRALVNENRQHFYGAEDMNNWTKRELLESFCPGGEEWQRRVVERGVYFANGFIPLLNANLTLQDLHGQIRPR